MKSITSALALSTMLIGFSAIANAGDSKLPTLLDDKELQQMVGGSAVQMTNDVISSRADLTPYMGQITITITDDGGRRDPIADYKSPNDFSQPHTLYINAPGIREDFALFIRDNGTNYPGMAMSHTEVANNVWFRWRY